MNNNEPDLTSKDFDLINSLLGSNTHYSLSTKKQYKFSTDAWFILVEFDTAAGGSVSSRYTVVDLSDWNMYSATSDVSLEDAISKVKELRGNTNA